VTGSRREAQPAAAGDEEAVRREREVEERHGCVWRERDARRGCDAAAGEYVYRIRGVCSQYSRKAKYAFKNWIRVQECPYFQLGLILSFEFVGPRSNWAIKKAGSHQNCYFHKNFVIFIRNIK
jgi:hypothetical protein